MSRRRPSGKPCFFPGCLERIGMKRVFCFDHFYLLPQEMQKAIKAAMDGPNGDLAVHRHPEGGTSMAQRAVALIQRSIRNGAKPPPRKVSTWIPATRKGDWR